MLRPVFDMLIMSVIQSSSMNLLLMSANIYQDFIMGGQHAEHLHYRGRLQGLNSFFYFVSSPPLPISDP